MQGNAISTLVMYAWIPIVLYIFNRYPAQRAVIISFILAWMFLPQAELVLPGVPDYNRMSATCYGILLATLIFDVDRFTSFKLSWIDLPILVWGISPFLSSITNGLGAYDGFSSSTELFMSWGIPYFLGRLYLSSLFGLRQLAIAIFIGGMVYVPLCLFESRMSTSLHLLVYGFQILQQTFLYSIRYGGYRPSVFMVSGLMVGVWMMLASMVGVILWRTKVIKKLWNMPMGFWVGLLLITFVFIRSTGAYLLFILGLLAMFVAKWFRTSIVNWIITIGICVYIYLGVVGSFPGPQIVAGLAQFFPPDRVQSVEFRFQNEVILGEQARKRMLFGWGGFGRNRVFDEYGQDVTITDSLWIIIFGINGLFGLLSLTAAILLPPLTFFKRYPARLWFHPAVSSAAVLAVGIVMYMLDCVLNAMINPIFMLAAGGVAGLAIRPLPRELAKLKL